MLKQIQYKHYFSFSLAPNHDIRGLLLFTWATWASTRCARSAPPNRLSRSSITSLYSWLLQLGCSIVSIDVANVVALSMHSQCIQKPTTTPNTKSWMWDEMAKKAWMVNACCHFMCTLECFFTLLACRISIPMIQLHLFLVLSSHLPSLNQWEKTQRFLWWSEQCQEIECFRSV